MQKLIWILGLWLVGIGQAAAVDLTTPESLNYRVYWGLLRVGDAQITYVPSGRSYVLRAVVKDTSSLIELDDAWESRGVHTAKRAFGPTVYSVKQAENSYRADKTMTFDARANVVRYKNNRDPSDVAEPMALGQARDVLSTVFAWRFNGVEEVQRAAKTDVVNLKKVVTLQREAGVRTVLKLGNREFDVWRVKLVTLKGDKPSKDSWIVYLRNDAVLTPLQIIATTKFGTFRATLVD